MDDLVSVVILTCGKKDYFRTCLAAVLRQTFQALDIILIDNSLDPNVSRAAAEMTSKIRIYSSQRNLYYCEAMNKGIDMSRGDYILCLNDDVTLDSFFVDEAIKGFSNGSHVGMVSGKILRQDGITLDSTGLFLSIWRTARERGYGLVDRKQFESEGEIFGVSGAVAFYRRKMLEDVREPEGWFDPDYRIFYEDLDISWRAHRNGWSGYYMPHAVAYHVRGASVRSGMGAGKSYARKYLSDELHRDLIKNRYLTIIKNETLVGFLVHLLPILLHDLCAWAFIFVQRPRVMALLWADGECFSSAWKKRCAAGRS